MTDDVIHAGAWIDNARRLPIAALHASPTNPRKTFPEESLRELGVSIKQHGVLQPIVVRPRPEGGYEIVAGERRWRACVLAQEEWIPALVRELMDLEVIELQVIENLQREDLDPIEEAEGYQALLNTYQQRTGWTVDDLALKVGKSKAYIYSRLKLAALCPEGRAALRKGELTPTVALKVARLPDPGLQAECVQQLLDASRHGEPLTADEAQRLIEEEFMTSLAAAPFPLDDETIEPGACTHCPKRSGNQPELFGDAKRGDFCLDSRCFGEKRRIWLDRKRVQAEEAGTPVLTGAAARKIFNGWTKPGWTRLDAPCYEAPLQHPDGTEIDEGDDTDYRDAKRPTWREVLKDADVATTMVQTEDGEIVELLEERAGIAALAERGVIDKGRAKRLASIAARQNDHAATQKKREAAAKRERAVRAAIFDAVHQDRDLDDGDRRMIAEALFRRTDHATRIRLKPTFPELFEGSGSYLSWEASTVRLRKALASMTAGQVDRLTFDLALAGELGVEAHTSASKPTMLLAVAERRGVDVAKIRKAVAAEERAKAKPKAKKSKAAPAAGKKAVPKKSAARAKGAPAPAQPGPTQAKAKRPGGNRRAKVTPADDMAWPFPRERDGAPASAGEAEVMTPPPTAEDKPRRVPIRRRRNADAPRKAS